MSTWTDDETRELVTLWPKASAAQIARRLHRPRAAICAKVNRLRLDGVLPDTGGAKHFDINPRTPKPRAGRPPQIRILPPPPPPPSDDRLAMRPCVLLELDSNRCHWPLGEVHQVATLFCGGPTAPGHRYCPQHRRVASRN